MFVTKEMLAAALRKWDADAKAGQYPDRTDEQRFDDSAQTLLDYMRDAEAAAC